MRYIVYVFKNGNLAHFASRWATDEKEAISLAKWQFGLWGCDECAYLVKPVSNLLRL